MTDLKEIETNENNLLIQSLCSHHYTYDIDNLSNISNLNITNIFNLLPDLEIQYKLIKIKLNDDVNKPLLIVMPGLSPTSVCNNLSIIIKNLSKIKDKYKDIFIFSLIGNNEQIKDLQLQFIEKKNTYKGSNNQIKETMKNILLDLLQETMATHYSKIIKKIIIDSKSNTEFVDIMGISFGGGIATFISSLEQIKIRQLILAAPSLYVGLKIIPENIKIILGWCIDDKKVDYLTAGKKSIEELSDIKYKNNVIVLNSLSSERLQILEKKKETVPIIFELLTHSLQDEIFDVI